MAAALGVGAVLSCDLSECFTDADCASAGGGKYVCGTDRKCTGVASECSTPCSGATPLCKAPPGAPAVCVECLGAADCTLARPLCSPETNSCKGCYASGEGCFGAATCDPAANNGAGACICQSNTDCGGVAPQCDGSTQTCKTCLANHTGCGGATPLCDTSANEGLGRCVQCLDDSVCGGATPVCDVEAGVCKACLADNTGCSGGTPVCDVSAAGGQGQCVGCLTNAHCTGAETLCDSDKVCKACLTDNTGCGGTTPHCDTAANGGRGACSCHVVVNEVSHQTGVAPTTGWVELYNPCASAIDLGAHKVVFQLADCGLPEDTLYTFGGTYSFAAGAYVIVAENGNAQTFPSPKLVGAATKNFGANGAVGLRTAASALVDAVGFGGNSCSLTEGQPFPQATVVNGSVARNPNGKDSNNNSSDFITRPSGNTTGGAPNQ